MALTKEQITEIEQAAAKYMYYHRPPSEIPDVYHILDMLCYKDSPLQKTDG